MKPESVPTVVVDLERLRVMNCGLGRFALHLGTALREKAPADLRFTFLVPPGSKHFSLVQGERQFHVRRCHGSAWLRLVPTRLSKWAGIPEGDLWHVTDQHSRYWPTSSRTPVLLTIHDLNFLREKPLTERVRRVRKLQGLADRASAIATISEFSAGEIRNHLQLRGKPLRVIHNGLSAPRMAESCRPEWTPSGRLLFTIGEVTAKKNFHVLFDMMGALPEYRLVIAGRKRSSYSRFLEREVDRRQLTQQVFLPGEVSDAERQWLYEHCEAFLFPSITEGFGLPVIEAMSFGKPVFITRGTSLPEIGGEMAQYWDDFEPQGMVRRFHEGLEQTRKDPGFVEKCRHHADRFSWQSAAAQYIDFYRELLGTKQQVTCLESSPHDFPLSEFALDEKLGLTPIAEPGTIACAAVHADSP
jgi:glycosyltransferase involved in cell wall biosynthesis